MMLRSRSHDSHSSLRKLDFIISYFIKTFHFIFARLCCRDSPWNSFAFSFGTIYLLRTSGEWMYSLHEYKNNSNDNRNDESGKLHGIKQITDAIFPICGQNSTFRLSHRHFWCNTTAAVPTSKQPHKYVVQQKLNITVIITFDLFLAC